MSRESALELKVGSFVLAAVVVLSFFVVSVTDLSVFEKGHRVDVVFRFVNGMRDAAPVRLAGVEAGVVKGLEVFVDEGDNKQTKVRVHVFLNKGITIPEDSSFTVNQLGLLGEKYLEIMPGTSSQMLKDNALVVGRDPVPIEKITEQVSLITQKLEVTLDGVNSGLLTEKNKKSIETTLEGLAVLGENLKNGSGTIGRLLTDETIYKNLDDLTVDLKQNPWKLLYRPKK